MSAIVALLVWLGISLGAHAQEAMANLTMEHRHTIVEFLKDEKMPPQAMSSPSEGRVVPASVRLAPVPTELGNKVSQIKQLRFFRTKREIVLVSGNDRKIVDVIDIK